MTAAIRAAYGALWAATLAGVALAHADAWPWEVPAPRPALTPTVATATDLATHNAIVALWPLALVAIGWPKLPGARRLGDGLIATQLAAHGLVVGGAVGQQPALWRYLPHLPLEWLAIAAPAGAWIFARRVRPPGFFRLASTVVVVVVALAAAAAAETFLTPITTLR